MEIHQIGRHVTGFEAPDVLYMKLVGDVSDEEVKEINKTHLAYAEKYKDLFYLIDLSELDNLAPQVRKRPPRWSGCCLCEGRRSMARP